MGIRIYPAPGSGGGGGGPPTGPAGGVLADTYPNPSFAEPVIFPHGFEIGEGEDAIVFTPQGPGELIISGAAGVTHIVVFGGALSVIGAGLDEGEDALSVLGPTFLQGNTAIQDGNLDVTNGEVRAENFIARDGSLGYRLVDNNGDDYDVATLDDVDAPNAIQFGPLSTHSLTNQFTAQTRFASDTYVDGAGLYALDNMYARNYVLSTEDQSTQVNLARFDNNGDPSSVIMLDFPGDPTSGFPAQFGSTVGAPRFELFALGALFEPPLFGPFNLAKVDDEAAPSDIVWGDDGDLGNYFPTSLQAGVSVLAGNLIATGAITLQGKDVTPGTAADGVYLTGTASIGGGDDDWHDLLSIVTQVNEWSDDMLVLANVAPGIGSDANIQIRLKIDGVEQTGFGSSTEGYTGLTEPGANATIATLVGFDPSTSHTIVLQWRSPSFTAVAIDTSEPSQSAALTVLPVSLTV